MKLFKEVIPYLIIIIIVILIRTYIIIPAQVNKSSMEPTLLDKEIILLNKIGYHINGIKRFDIIVVMVEGYGPLVKRVIGLPGERLEYNDNKLYINGNYIAELNTTNKNTSDFILENTIPSDKYFIMGDNRNNSIDSRTFGVIDKKNIIGRVDYALYPLSKFGKVK